MVPYDGSKPSENALQQAIQMVNDLVACKVRLVNDLLGVLMI
jgi:hypothetical protein